MAFGCYGASAVTALTAQNTSGVQAVNPVSPEFVEQQVARRVLVLLVFVLTDGGC